MKRFSYPPINSKTEFELREKYADDISKLEILLERDFLEWKN